jgi:hypothetical protein
MGATYSRTRNTRRNHRNALFDLSLADLRSSRSCSSDSYLALFIYFHTRLSDGTVAFAREPLTQRYFKIEDRSFFVRQGEEDHVFASISGQKDEKELILHKYVKVWTSEDESSHIKAMLTIERVSSESSRHTK